MFEKQIYRLILSLLSDMSNKSTERGWEIIRRAVSSRGIPEKLNLKYISPNVICIQVQTIQTNDRDNNQRPSTSNQEQHQSRPILETCDDVSYLDGLYII